MASKARKAFLTTAVVILAASVAEARQSSPAAPQHQPYEGPPRPIELNAAPPPVSGPRRPLTDADAAALKSALDAARRGDSTKARTAIGMIGDPLARKIATWALADSAAESMSFFEADQARRDLAGWPRGQRRLTATEKLLSTSGQSPQRVIEWFGGGQPATPEGAMALASAYQATGKPKDAEALIRDFWRNKIFEVAPQRAMLSRFGPYLTQDDHIRRADIVMYGSQGPAAREMLPLLPPDHQALAQARMALRSGAANANTLASALPPQFATHPGLAFERAAFYRKRNLESLALAQLRYFPTEVPHSEMADRIWDERYRLVLFALRNGDTQGAYAAAANSGLTTGGDAADAEFYAGWLALTRLRNAEQADKHFANLERIGSSPITRGRALYWRGRAAEAAGDQSKARGFYGAAAKFNTTFYGQLAGEKTGGRMTLDPDPQITQADRARFEGREPVRAARLLAEMGDRDRFRAFVLALDDILPTAEEQALLVDLTRGYGDQDTSMKVVRTAAQRGFVLTGRGYPVRTPPPVSDAPEQALTLGVTRQESGFDPLVRSGVGARGMMQLMPATASITARRVGLEYSPGRLDDPDFNMQLGQAYLGQMIGTFSGSYPMAIAAYNAGPGRPTQWVNFCGDPRGATTDPIDFIECIPFSETRNYVMRVMEGMQVYRAKLAGGTAQITLTSDLKRGAYGTYAGPARTTPSAALQIGGSNAPIPNPE